MLQHRGEGRQSLKISPTCFSQATVCSLEQRVEQILLCLLCLRLTASFSPSAAVHIFLCSERFW